MFIDSHAHLNFNDYASDFADVVARAKQADVEKVVNIGTSMADAREVIDLAEKYDWMFAAVGIHPNDDLQVNIFNIDWGEFENLTKSHKVVAIGETGLDYLRLPSETKPRNEEIKRQKELFLKQIELAAKLGLPLSVHIRDAQDDTMEIFDMLEKPIKGVFHCFSGDLNYLGFIMRKLPDFYVSFAGNITFKNAQQLRDLAKSVPLERMLLETDCPFLTPEPNRGNRNEPANIVDTALTLAMIKGLSVQELGRITSENAQRLFGI